PCQLIALPKLDQPAQAGGPHRQGIGDDRRPNAPGSIALELGAGAMQTVGGQIVAVEIDTGIAVHLQVDVGHRIQSLSKEAAGRSRKTSQSPCCWRMLAGCRLVTLPARQSATAWAFRWSGTVQLIDRLAMIWRMLMLMAWAGTLWRSGNQPSPSCWRRQASSRLTTR